LTSFSSLFLVNFHVSILDESHHLLIKRSCKIDGENLDGFKSKICSMLFAAYVAVAQEIVVIIIMIAFSVFTRF